MVKYFKNYAYTIVELAISLVILGVILIVSVNTVSKSSKEKVIRNIHGWYACYYDKEGKLREVKFEDGKEPVKYPLDTGEKCEFTTPTYAKYLIMSLIGGGAGSNSEYAGQNGNFISKFIAAPEKKYSIEVGKGGKDGNNGGDTKVFSQEHEIFNAKGGTALYDAQNIQIEDISKCVVVPIDGTNCFEYDLKELGYAGDEFSSDYVCDLTPTCEIIGNNIRYTFCGYKSTSRLITLPFRNEAFEKCTEDDMEYIWSVRKPDPYKRNLISKKCINALLGTKNKNEIDNAYEFFTTINFDIVHDKFTKEYFKNNMSKIKTDGVFIYYDTNHLREDLEYIPGKYEEYPFNPVSSRKKGDYWCDGRSSFDIYFYLNKTLSSISPYTKMKNYIDTMEYDVYKDMGRGANAAKDGSPGQGGGIIINW